MSRHLFVWPQYTSDMLGEICFWEPTMCVIPVNTPRYCILQCSNQLLQHHYIGKSMCLCTGNRKQIPYWIICACFHWLSLSLCIVSLKSRFTSTLFKLCYDFTWRLHSPWLQCVVSVVTWHSPSAVWEKYREHRGHLLSLTLQFLPWSHRLFFHSSLLFCCLWWRH